MPTLKKLIRRRHTAATRKPEPKPDARPARGFVHKPRRQDLEDPWLGTIKPSTVRNAVTDAVRGNPEAFVEQFRWALRSDMTLSGAIDDRLFSLTGLEWEIIPATNLPGYEDQDTDLANDAAAMVREQLVGLRGFDEFLEHNAQGLTFGVSVSEIIWRAEGQRHVLDHLVCVPHTAIWTGRGDSIEEPNIIRVSTGDQDFVGVRIDEFPNKFIVHQPEYLGPSPFGGGVAMRTLVPACTKRFGVQWLWGFVEGYGEPYRFGTWTGNPDATYKSKFEDGLANFGTHRYIGVPDTFQLQLIEASKGRGSFVHVEAVDLVDRWYHEYICGGQLTRSTSQSGGGAYALGQVHERVAERLQKRDQKREAATIRNQLLSPMVALSELSGAPVPFFCRKPSQQKDELKELEKLERAQRIGLDVTRGYAYDVAGIAPPADDANLDAVLVKPAPAGGFGGLGFGGFGEEEEENGRPE